jgi:hypothetical protein
MNPAATIPLSSEFRQRRNLITLFATLCAAVVIATEINSSPLQIAPVVERKQLQKM